MQYSYIARQPILDKDKNLFAYELLFRDGPKNCFPQIAASVATSRLISEHFLCLHNRIKGDALSFVNFSYEELINEFPTLLPLKRVVIEILESSEPTDELFDAIKSMHSKGYRFALDDFIPNENWNRFLTYIDYIKFDISQISIPEAAKVIRKHCTSDICFIAERIETHDEFNQAKQAGFKLFQGYFFSKPEMLKHKQLEPIILNLTQLITETTTAPLDYSKIEHIISRDVSLSYKLLALVNNSPSVRVKIQSFKQAIAYLGEGRIKKFVALLALTTMGYDKPQYLYGLSIQTAQFCEKIALHCGIDIDSGAAFLTGLFCYLDSLIDIPLDEIFEQLPVDDKVKQALLFKTGTLGDIIELALAYEHAQWQLVTDHSEKLNISGDVIAQCYAESIQWTAELFVE